MEKMNAGMEKMEACMDTDECRNGQMHVGMEKMNAEGEKDECKG